MRRSFLWLLLLVLASPGCEVFLPARGGPQQPCLAGGKCRAGLVCVEDTCTKLAGECAGDDGVPCEDNDPCTSAGYCQDGVCQLGHPDRDDDGDGFVAAECGGTDCDDQSPLVNPEVPEAIAGSELCGDVKDNDCDNDTDAGDSGCQQQPQQRFCNTDWCWYNRLPMGNSLNAAWSDGENTWVVGDAGTIIELTPVPAQVQSGVTANLQGIGGCGSGIIWAVGLNGTALLYDGQGWIPQYQGSEDLFAVWCSGPEDAYLVGQGGTVLRWNGTGLDTLSVGTDKKLTGVSGSGPDDVWVVGYSGGIFHFNGNQWTQVGTGLTTANLHGVWSSALGEAWIVGDGGTVLKCFSDSSCSMVAPDTNRSFRAVFGKSPGEVWIAGTMGEIRHFDGSSWTLEDAGLGIVFKGLAVDAPGRVTVVGEYGSIVTRSAGGQSWKRLTSGTRSNVYAIRGRGDVLLAVADKEILVFDGQVWRGAGVSAPEILQGLTASSTGEFWAVGDGGTILHGSGTPLEWTTENSGTTNRLNAAWSVGDGTVWAVGDKSTILRRNTQGTWEGANTGVSGEVHFYDVWAGSSEDAWAVGSGGNVYHWDGSRWSRKAQGVTDAALQAVWSVADQVWAVGGEATILRIDNGAPGVTQPLYPRRILYDAWGKGSDDVWVVGEHGVVLHWDGNSWTEQASGADTTLRAIWCRDDNKSPSCWLGGFSGAILGSDS